MLEAAVAAAGLIFEPSRFAFLMLGVLIGLGIGVLPGLGGLVGLSLLLPFTFTMDPYSAFALIMGLLAVVVTSDTIPAVLFGVPGTVGSAATILDGYPMARRGEAGRAFGAAFTASLLGGLFGAALLAVSIPVLRPVVLLISSPELVAFCVFGLSLVATLSGNDPLKGLVVAAFGVLLAFIGEDSQIGELRWTFESLYLWEGLPVVPVALGLFALPELADLAIARKSIAKAAPADYRTGQWQGVKDVLRARFLMVRCAFIGSGLGAIPGIGASIIDWVAYGHAARTEKDAQKSFGTGDVRGVIASESSNNAKEGGALVPTLAFGVPGTPSMALVLGALLVHGIVPGPRMLTEKLDITYTFVWSLALANVIGAAICFLATKQLARIALLRAGILVPAVLAVVYVGAFQGRNDWGDFYVMLGFGLLGWAMKRLGWPRPALVLGFVLGGLLETYLFISVKTFGLDWLARPGVIALFALTLWGIARPVLKRRRSQDGRAQGWHARDWRIGRPCFDASMPLTLTLAALFAAALITAQDWPLGAGIGPRLVASVGFGLSLLALIAQATVRRKPVADSAGEGPRVLDLQMAFPDLSKREVVRRAAIYFGWLALFLALAYLVNILPAMLLFLIAYLRLASAEPWPKSVLIGGAIWLPLALLFDKLLRIPWPEALINIAFPGLRSTIGLV